MNRQLYYSQLKVGTAEAFCAAIRQDDGDLRSHLQTEQVLTGSLFISDRYLCLYMETVHDSFDWDWPAAYAEWLEAWPGEHGSRLSVQMLDIFHDGVPTDPDSWRESRQVDGRIGCIARLKPEMAASYIYYHYRGRFGTISPRCIAICRLPISINAGMRQARLFRWRRLLLAILTMHAFSTSWINCTKSLVTSRSSAAASWRSTKLW
ncbi:hypothetical protein SAMN04487897_11029 [Paenibacillus sp. yr247]|nr:hypothetical protein SAMN04487897_11029 [Paenibacillus sp. yr247]